MRLASSCIVYDRFGGIWGALFSLCSQVCGMNPSLTPLMTACDGYTSLDISSRRVVTIEDNLLGRMRYNAAEASEIDGALEVLPWPISQDWSFGTCSRPSGA